MSSAVSDGSLKSAALQNGNIHKIKSGSGASDTHSSLPSAALLHQIIQG